MQVEVISLNACFWHVSRPRDVMFCVIKALCQWNTFSCTYQWLEDLKLGRRRVLAHVGSGVE